MRNSFACVVAISFLLEAGILSKQACAEVPIDGSAAGAAIQAILADQKVIKTLDDIKSDQDAAFAEQKRITEIPAPPFKEMARAHYFLNRVKELGIRDAAIDSEGNVVALRNGSGPGRPKLVVSAHLDTVFPVGTDVTVKEKDGVSMAPGIGDDSRGLAALLSLIKIINANGIVTVGDVLFVGTAGEEELGNLRGVKALFRDHSDIDGFISIDGLGITRIVNQATGSHRYEMIFKGPGGHSFQEFVLPSAIHAMGRAIAKISELQTPSDPKTTFTVGTVSGGTSVNAIASEARMTVDMRSNSSEELLKLEGRLLEMIKEAVAEENTRWKSDRLSVEIKLIGDRPAGLVALDSPMVQAVQRSVAVIARGPRATFAGSSTDSNLAISLGIPAVTISGGGEGGNWHSLNEWYRPTNAWHGPQNALVTILALMGLDGVTKPTLAVRATR